jgi:hypothetical protein
MKLYKYCKSEHNPLNGCKTLKLNTTSHFRNNYSGKTDYINDDQEGLSTGIDSNNNVFVRTKFAPDSYLFCTSLEKTNCDSVLESFDPNYNSCYCISDAEKFGEQLFKIVEDYLKNNLTFENFPPNVIRRIKQYIIERSISFEVFKSELKIEYHLKPIDYSNGSLTPINDFRRVHEQFILSSFCKPLKYSPQKEFRFAFAIYHQKTDASFDITEKEILVEFDNILNFIEACD